MNYMLEQIKSIPDLIRDNFQVLDRIAYATLHPETVMSLKRIFITGCGDSHHATINTELAFETITGLPVEVAPAMQFARYGAGFIPKTGPGTNLVIGISVSGEVSRTYEALLMGRQAGATTLALTATPGSRVSQAGDLLFQIPNTPFPAPEDTIVPGVRSFIINQVALLLMAVRIGEVRGHINSQEAVEYRKDLLASAGLIENAINDNEESVKQLAYEWRDANEFVLLGAGPNFGIALFTAAKILEASGDPAIGQDTEEWAHLQYFARQANTPTIFITAGDRDASRIAEVITAAKQIGRRVVIICPENSKELIDLAKNAWTFGKISEMFSPLVSQIPGELFAAYRAEVINEPFFREFGGGRSTEGGGGISRIRTSDHWETWKK